MGKTHMKLAFFSISPDGTKFITLKEMPNKVIIQKHTMSHKILTQFFYRREEIFYPYGTEETIKCYEHQ